MSSTNLPQMSGDTPAQRAEKVTGAIVGAGLIAGGGYLLYKFLPYLIVLLENTIYAVILGVVLVALLTVVLDKRFWQIGRYLYRVAMRKIASLFVQIDPIAILKTYIEEGHEKLERVDAQITRISGRVRVLKDEIEKNEKEREQALKMSKLAHDQQKRGVFTVHAKKAGLLKEANLSYDKTLKMAEGMHRVLVRLREVAETFVQTLEVEVDVKSRQYEVIKDSWSAIRSAMSILKGSTDEKYLFDMAMEHIIQDSSMKLGEIEDHMRVASTFVEAIDIQNGVFEADALQSFQDWESKTDSLLLGNEKQLLLEGHGGGKSDDDYKQFFAT